jgi:hypothetical protein
MDHLLGFVVRRTTNSAKPLDYEFRGRIATELARPVCAWSAVGKTLKGVEISSSHENRRIENSGLGNFLDEKVPFGVVDGGMAKPHPEPGTPEFDEAFEQEQDHCAEVARRLYEIAHSRSPDVFEALAQVVLDERHDVRVEEIQRFQEEDPPPVASRAGGATGGGSRAS